MPKLVRLKNVSLEKLFPDPENPRFGIQTHSVSNIDDATRQLVLHKIYEGEYQILELVKNIQENGWLKLDLPVVERVNKGEDKFIILEGNRRYAALRKYNETASANDGIPSIDVVEVVSFSDESEEERREYIASILGMCNFGGLKQWSPYAQAQDLTRNCLKESSDNVLIYRDATIEKVACAASLNKKTVKERVSTYCHMLSISDYMDKNPKYAKGCIKENFYSLFRDLVMRKSNKSNKLRDYFGVSDLKEGATLQFNSEEKMDLLIDLCQLGEKNRERDGMLAPINDPKQWSYFDKLLQEKDEKWLDEVLIQRRHPIDVYRELDVSRRDFNNWSDWLTDVCHHLRSVTINDLEMFCNSERDKMIFKRLDDELQRL